MIKLSAGFLLAAGLITIFNLQAKGQDQDWQRRELVNELSALANSQGIELSLDQREQIRNDCLTIQANQLKGFKNDLFINKPIYDQVTADVAGWIWAVSDRLGKAKIDASWLNLVMVDLWSNYRQLNQSTKDYNRRIDQALSLNCLAYEREFLAALVELDDQRSKIVGAQARLEKILETSLPLAIDKTECHYLLKPNQEKCH